MNMKVDMDQMLQTVYPDMVQWRRYLHRHPEVSFQEKETSNWITARLHEIGCEVEKAGSGYGLVVTIRGNKPGPTIALRADIDALPIQDEKACEYASTVPGAMHACGHDAHTATMLGIAAYYNSVKDQLAWGAAADLPACRGGNARRCSWNDRERGAERCRCDLWRSFVDAAAIRYCGYKGRPVYGCTG